MLRLATVVEGDVDISASTILNTKVEIKSAEEKVNIGNNNVIEDRCIILDSCIGDNNLIEIRTTVEKVSVLLTFNQHHLYWKKSQIGHKNIIGTKCIIRNSRIGNNCCIMATIELNNVIIPDNTSVYLCDSGWRCKPVNNNLAVSIFFF